MWCRISYKETQKDARHAMEAAKEDFQGAPMVLDYNNQPLSNALHRKPFWFRFDVTNVGIFVLAILNSDLEALGTRVHNHLDSGRTLDHNVGLGRVQGQMGIKIPNLVSLM